MIQQFNASLTEVQKRSIFNMLDQHFDLDGKVTCDHTPLSPSTCEYLEDEDDRQLDIEDYIADEVVSG